MQERRITVVSTQTNDVKTIQSNITTFKELKNEFPTISWEDKNVTVRENRINLELDDAELPQTDFTVFVMPGKVKSGSNIDTLPYNELRRKASAIGIKYNHQTKEELKRLIKEYYGDRNSGVSNDQDPVEIIEQLRVHINSKLYNLETSIRNSDSTKSYNDYQSEIKEVANELGLRL